MKSIRVESYYQKRCCTGRGRWPRVASASWILMCVCVNILTSAQWFRWYLESLVELLKMHMPVLHQIRNSEQGPEHAVLKSRHLILLSR